MQVAAMRGKLAQFGNLQNRTPAEGVAQALPFSRGALYALTEE